MEASTDSVRVLAPRWSLAGDEKLLNILQGTHQRIVSKCQEVNAKLGDMASALDKAAINLHNVNNKFMALSNSQFIESRVYDDDDDVAPEARPVEGSTKEGPLEEGASLRRSLSALAAAHQQAEILDLSDSDDSDAEISVILRHKDAYAHRPLPHVIGTAAWRSKWHAGLIIEDSESDSDTSKRGRELELYSESEDDAQTDMHAPDTLPDTSSSFHSEKDLSAADKRTPADVAAELAARLGNAPPRVLHDTEDISPLPTPRPVYRPQHPVASTIFSDEPPPLCPRSEGRVQGQGQGEGEGQGEEEEEGDIFAEISRRQPPRRARQAQDAAGDLFGSPGRGHSAPIAAKHNPHHTLFDDELEPALFEETPPKRTLLDEDTPIRGDTDDKAKKPVGGISLFGTNKGTESIGAAILKRNQRKSSTSDNESDSNTRSDIKNESADDYDEGDNVNNANYIFDNLFAKAKQAEQKMVKPVKIDKPVKEKPKATTKDVKDLFSDNIFDDIDDIFTSNIKIPTKEDKKNVKSIFDDEDLFSDVATPIQEAKATSSKKSIFDSDDLFSDIEVTKKSFKTVETDYQINKPVPSKSIKETNNSTTKQPEFIKTPIINDFPKNIGESSKFKPKAKSESIFDSDSDDDLFSEFKIKTRNPQKNMNREVNGETESDIKNKETKLPVTESLKTENAKVFRSPSLFEEDEIDDLFINAHKAKMVETIPEDTQHEIKENISDLNQSLGIEDLKDVKTNNFKETAPSNVDSKKPVIVDTKPYVFPKIDEKPEEVVIKDNLVTKQNETKINKETQKNVMIDDFIDTSQEDTNVQSKSISNNEDIAPELKEPVRITNVIVTNVENEALLPEPQESIPNSNINLHKDKLNDHNIFDEAPVKVKEDLKPEPISVAAFDDIFSEPPAFEKTKETKKVANVNALFEDDSDDEALFFKKNDVISDEKPEIFSPSANFGLFDDEPPAFVDFASKSTQNDDDLFGSKPKKKANTSKVLRDIPPDVDEWNGDFEDQPITQKTTDKLFPDDDNNLFSSQELSKPVNTVKKTKLPSKEIPDSDEELFSKIPKNVPEPSQKETPEAVKDSIDQLDDIKSKNTKTDTDRDINKDTEAKKIGKLNTKNFNINVQALVPGASPKKIPKERSNENINIEQNTVNVTEQFENTEKKNIEKQLKTTKDEVSKTELDNAESKAKTITFESKPEAGVLDNNLSKQRAKIQVKRRPSSRRARHEAVRKSVIDLDDDTDNSCSFDEPLPKTINKQTNEFKFTTKVDQVLDESNNIAGTHVNTINAQKEAIDDVKTNKDMFNIHDEITKNKKTHKRLDVVDAKYNKQQNETENTQNVTKDHTPAMGPQSTTKVVYILDDHDIFSNKTEKAKLENELNTKNTPDLFKTTDKNNKNENVDPELSKDKIVIKAMEASAQKPFLFDLSDDEDDGLFGKTAKTKKVEVKSKLFESDSEDELFGDKANKKEAKKEKEEKREDKKGSLFGDDDDDLFVVKTITESKVPTSKARSTVSKGAAKSTETFDDPLSMLDD